MLLSFQKHKKNLQKGFTLVELVIVIIILSALGIATTSYIATGLDIYNDITVRDKALNSVRFVMERLQREVANALPNSAKVGAGCLTFYPIKSSSLYKDFPIYPNQGNEATMTAAISDYNFTAGDRAVVYLLNESELSLIDTNGASKSQVIDSINASKETLLFSSAVSFPLSSPARRVYIINDSLMYCFSGTNLYRQASNGTPILMAEGLSGSFDVVDATLQRNGLINVNFTLSFDGQEVAFEKTLHVNNVP